MLTHEQRLRMLEVPRGCIDMVLDTDAYNEIDDQFAICYALRRPDRLKVCALYAAPFLNHRSVSPEDGMVKSEKEIRNLLTFLGMERPVFAGSRQYLPDETTPVDSPAARDLADRAMAYSPEKPLYVAAIGAITNVASALLMNPAIADRIVIVWLGGHAQHWTDNAEFNLHQDIAAARVVHRSGAPLVMIPCEGVVSSFTTTGPELNHWLRGKNALCDYLVASTADEAESYAKGQPWSRVIWDVTVIAWLLNEDGAFLRDKLIPTPLPGYNAQWEHPDGMPDCRYVYAVRRDNLFSDLFSRLIQA